MELVNDFTVNATMDETWALLTDLERIAPCLPGAQLTEVEGDVYRGLVKVKVGPITAQFKGQASFVEQDAERHRAVLRGEGRDTTGKGNASALITAQLSPVSDEVTRCAITTDLTITGKVAQFGRGALADVSGKLIDQFVHNLETTVLADHRAHLAGHDVERPEPTPTHEQVAAAATDPATEPATAEPPKVRKIEQRDVQPVDLIDAAGAPMAKRLVPIGIIGLIVLLLLGRRRRRKG